MPRQDQHQIQSGTLRFPTGNRPQRGAVRCHQRRSNDKLTLRRISACRQVALKGRATCPGGYGPTGDHHQRWQLEMKPCSLQHRLRKSRAADARIHLQTNLTVPCPRSYGLDFKSVESSAPVHGFDRPFRTPLSIPIRCRSDCCTWRISPKTISTRKRGSKATPWALRYACGDPHTATICSICRTSSGSRQKSTTSRSSRM